MFLSPVPRSRPTRIGSLFSRPMEPHLPKSDDNYNYHYSYHYNYHYHCNCDALSVDTSIVQIKPQTRKIRRCPSLASLCPHSAPQASPKGRQVIPKWYTPLDGERYPYAKFRENRYTSFGDGYSGPQCPPECRTHRARPLQVTRYPLISHLFKSDNK